MSKLRQTAVGGKLLSLLSQTTKSRGKIATSAPLAPTANHNFVVRGLAFGLFVLAVTPFIFTIPAHADSISVDLDTTNVVLQRSGNLYKHNSSVHVHNSNDYGFTLSMNTSQPNLVNSKDSSYRIYSVSGINQNLAANQWGYTMSNSATTFSPVSSAILADIDGNDKGDCINIDDCILHITFGANLDPKRLPVGNYSTTLTYTATSKLRQAYTMTNDVPGPIDVFGTAYSPNISAMGTMPVEWVNGDWQSVPNPNSDNWYDYNQGKWAYGVNIAKKLGGTGWDTGGLFRFSAVFKKYSGNKVKVDYSDVSAVYVFVPRISKLGYNWSYVESENNTYSRWINLELICGSDKRWKTNINLGHEQRELEHAIRDLKDTVRDLTPVIGTPCPDGSMPKL